MPKAVTLDRRKACSPGILLHDISRATVQGHRTQAVVLLDGGEDISLELPSNTAGVGRAGC